MVWGRINFKFLTIDWTFAGISSISMPGLERDARFLEVQLWWWTRTKDAEGSSFLAGCFFLSVPEKVRFGQLISSLLVSFGFLLCTLTFHFMDVLWLKRNKSVFNAKVLKLATFRYASDGRILLQTVQFFQISRSHQPPICSVSSGLLALPAYSRDWDAYEDDHESLTCHII